MLSRYSKKFARFLSNEDGPTTVEYALLLAIIVGTIAASVSYLGFEVRDKHEVIGNTLETVLNK